MHCMQWLFDAMGVSMYFLRVLAYLLKGCTLHYNVASSDTRGAHVARGVVRGAFQHSPSFPKNARGHSIFSTIGS